MKERRWADRHRRTGLYKFANRAFQTQTMAARTRCGNCIVASWARPQEGDTVTTVTPNQPCTTPSDHVHAFTACSTVCTYVSRLPLFSLYRYRSVSALSGPSSHTITQYVSVYDPSYSLFPSRYTVILTNMICLGESATNITRLTHRTA